MLSYLNKECSKNNSPPVAIYRSFMTESLSVIYADGCCPDFMLMFDGSGSLSSRPGLTYAGIPFVLFVGFFSAANDLT